MWSPNTLASFQLPAYFSFQQNLMLLIIFLSCKALSWLLRHSYVLFFPLCFCLLFIFLLVSSLLLECSKGTAIFSHLTWSSRVMSCSTGVSDIVFVSLKYWFFNPFLTFGCIIGLTITLQVSYHPFKTCFLLLLLFDFFFFFCLSNQQSFYPIAQARNLGVIFSFSPFLTTYIKVWSIPPLKVPYMPFHCYYFYPKSDSFYFFAWHFSWYFLNWTYLWI